MFFLVSQGYRCIAADRRGHGHLRRRSRRVDGSLDLKDAVLVCHSTGEGVVARYIGRHRTKRVARYDISESQVCE
jgi:non-heme chloroperoxidase